MAGPGFNRHRGRRGEASTPRGGISQGMSRHVLVRRVEFGSGKSWFCLVRCFDEFLAENAARPS